MHLVCFFLAIPAGVTVVALAQSSRAEWVRWCTPLGLVALFGVSGSYHRVNWSTARRLWMQKLDHGTIFLMIAGSYTPVCLLVLERLGRLDDARDRVDRRGARASCSPSPAVGEPDRAQHALHLPRLGGGGGRSRRCGPTCPSSSSCSSRSAALLFTVGAVFLFTHWPDPFPRVFGYHEVWHLLVVAAVACHFVAIASMVHGPVAT